MAGPKLLRSIIFLAVWALLSVVVVVSQECEVCTDVLTEVVKRVTESSASVNDQEAIKSKLISYCEEVIGDDEKREKFCFFIGAHKQAATSIVNEVVKPLSFPKPPSKVCQELKAKDSQICDLKYDKPIDWDSLDLEKMRVKQLKELLAKLKGTCKGCTEKTDFIQRINELKPAKTEL